MEDDERLSRQAALYDIVRTHTSHTWAAILVKMLLNLVGSQNMTRHTPELDKEDLKEKYESASSRLLLFDYDVCLLLHLSVCCVILFGSMILTNRLFVCRVH
jgi:trehalose 6-phosphate synthase/phosphatase